MSRISPPSRRIPRAVPNRRYTRPGRRCGVYAAPGLAAGGWGSAGTERPFIRQVVF
jgi:hypothetical protein